MAAEFSGDAGLFCCSFGENSLKIQSSGGVNVFRVLNKSAGTAQVPIPLTEYRSLLPSVQDRDNKGLHGMSPRQFNEKTDLDLVSFLSFEYETQ